MAAQRDRLRDGLLHAVEGAYRTVPAEATATGVGAVAQHALAELCREHPEAKEAEICLLRLGKLHLQKLKQPDNAVGIFSADGKPMATPAP